MNATKQTEKKTPKRIRNGEKVKLNGTMGQVLFFWPMGVRPDDSWIQRIQDGKQVFDGLTSTRDRYLVEVERRGAKGQPLPPAYYSPFSGALERANPKAKRA